MNTTATSFNRAAYNHETDRDNLFNQTDFVYKTDLGWTKHTVAFGTEFGRQTGIDVRNTGIFPNGTNTMADNPFAPTYFGPINFVHHFGAVNAAGDTGADSNSRYRLNIESGYARDTVEITRYLQLIGGIRVDRFDMAATDMNTSTDRARVDTKVSPQAAVILKPVEPLSIYGVYAVSYLPASGDQFSALTNGTVILEPQRFENKEIGIKYNINPRLLFSAAVYQLDRQNVPLADPNNAGFFILSGSNRIRGFETELKGYVTPEWQSWLGYAYTDARVTSDTTATIARRQCRAARPAASVLAMEQISIHPDVGCRSRRHLLLGSFASSDDTVKLPGWVRVDGARLRHHRPALEGAAQRREHLQQRLLGLGRRQQQHLARPGPDDPPERQVHVLGARRPSLPKLRQFKAFPVWNARQGVSDAGTAMRSTTPKLPPTWASEV